MEKHEIADIQNTTPFDSKERSDGLMNYFLITYFMLGLVFAVFYDTWLIAIAVGSLNLLAYYSTKLILPNSSLYQYVLSAVFGIFMAQFIYQMHGMFEMHFFAFIGSALLITYQKWKLQIPMLVVVMVHHATFGYLQNIGYGKVYFTLLTVYDLRTFAIHVALAGVIFFICGLWAYQLKLYHEKELVRTLQIADLQKQTSLSLQLKEHDDERNTILESIGDAFFALDKNWVVLYWNNMAEKALMRSRDDVISRNIWEAYPDYCNSVSYQMYHQAVNTNKPVHFEDYYPPLNKWYEISAYPSEKGLSVYFKDITERKQSQLLLEESEKKYSDLFQLSPLPKWVFDVETLRFLDVNAAAVAHYGYSKEEFLAMTIKDIRLPEDMSKLEETLAEPVKQHQLIPRGIFNHKKKNGEIIQVDIQSNSFQYQGKTAKIILVNDVTDRLHYIKAIEDQNKRLREISWIQSHIVRAPLSRILGLIPLIKESNSVENIDEMLQYIFISAQELDEVIREITDKTEAIDPTIDL